MVFLRRFLYYVNKIMFTVLCQSEDKSPVHGEHLSGDEARVVAREVGNCGGDVLRPSETAQRRFLGKLRQHLARQGIQHVGFYYAGRNAVDADVRGRKLGGQ